MIYQTHTLPYCRTNPVLSFFPHCILLLNSRDCFSSDWLYPNSYGLSTLFMSFTSSSSLPIRMDFLLCRYCYYRLYTRMHTWNEIPNLTPKISDLIRLFLPRRSSPSSLTTASTVLLLTPVNRPTSPSPLPPLSARNPRSTRPSLLLLPLLPYPVKHRGIDTALLLPVGTGCPYRSLPSPMPSICPVAPNNRNTLYMPRT
jgi:hypothetical protein